VLVWWKIQPPDIKKIAKVAEMPELVTLFLILYNRRVTTSTPCCAYISNIVVDAELRN